ncbi:DAK2 domain-containing protein [Nocardia sp. NPDC005366]|uniref:DAK2 domain-containing protein n=1 Tax=Nocardia sp. NPDC005366 TaxID=3156878 RepID=UPI00339DC165
MDGAALLRWGWTCLAGLEQRREEINALNVFPIADSDTGTNMLATMRAAVQAAQARAVSPTGREQGAVTEAAGDVDTPPVDAIEISAHEVAAAMARGATLGARGNSGIILSQVLRGIAEATAGGPLTAATLADALERAGALVREALSVPVEGTILTVLECAGASAAARRGASLAEVALAAADGAAKALGDTPSQLGVLREAGVVDAGARGLVVLLDGLVSVIRGEAPARPDYLPGDLEVGPGARSSRGADSGADAPEPHFEVMYLLADTDETRVAALRDRLGALGDSVAVVGDGAGSWSAHVHCADAGAAVEAGLAAGTLGAIRIESFVVTASIAEDDCSPEARRTVDGGYPGARDSDGRAVDAPVDRAVLAVAAGEGAAALFEAAGAVVLGGDDPITATALLTAIRRMPNREVLVLPNGALPAHELVAVGVAARDARRDVLMLPSGSMVQGLAALAVHDRGRIAVDDAFAMSEAAAATRWGSLRAAAHRALTMVGTCDSGDGLGLVGNDVVLIERDVLSAGRTLLDRMLGLGGELVTLLMGAGAPEGLAGELAAHIARGFPGVEVTVYSGGQQEDLVQIGVE